jgi:hypothetical protein
MTHGLKSLAQQLPQYGRYNDDMVAHISSDEARLLKSLGGSGTINPTTGLPEFGFFKSVAKPFQQAAAFVNPFNPGSGVNKIINDIPVVGDINKGLNNLGTQVFQPLEKAIVQPASAGLASLDKAVGKAVPGGWGTLASVAGSAMGLPTPMLVGMGALNGSGVMRKGGNFNLQGAMMGGAMAYAAGELGEYARGGSDAALEGAKQSAVQAVEEAAKNTTTDGISSLYNSTGGFGQTASAIPQGAIDAANVANPALLKSTDTAALNALSKSMESGAGAGLQVAPQPSIFSNLASGNFGYAADQIGTKIGEGATSLINAPGQAIDAVKNYDYSNALDKGLSNAGDTASGIKNLVTGAPGASAAAKAAAASAGTMSPMMATGMAAYSGMGLAALEEQKKFLEESKAANAITQAEYDSAMAEINRSTEDARRAVRENPFSTNPSRDTSIGETYYGRNNESDNLYSRSLSENTLYAMGGSINPPDDQTGMPNRSPMTNFDGGIMGYAAGGMPPRFLSGGGDGMSDDIPATINGKQEARLADGEFVIPADVVSHLGNGSSKAGAKQLYSMMDKVRTARTGRKSQGKQINPRKYLAA